MSVSTTRVRGMADWRPQAKTLALLTIVRDILLEYAAYLPLTIRQIFYRLVGVHDYPKDELAYERLGEMINRARRASYISFDAIRDDGADIRTAMDWADAAALIEVWRRTAETFRLDRQQRQPRRLLIMVEAAGMKPQIETVSHDYSIPVIPSGGFDSLTAKRQLADQLGARDGLTEVLHIGDHDPSGVHLFTSMAEDVQELIADNGLPGEARFTRLAVTSQQIADLKLPTAPAKATDRRSFEGQTTQAEAIPPDVLARIVTDAITSRIDPNIYTATLRREARIRRQLIQRLDSLPN